MIDESLDNIDLLEAPGMYSESDEMQLITETQEEFDARNQGCFCCTEAFTTEAKASIMMSFPLILGFLAQNAVTIVNLVFLGHLTDDDLASAALAMLFCNITGISLGSGMLSTFDTLGSQSFGARNYKRVGVILQRAILIVSVEMIPIAVLWYFSQHLLKFAIEEKIANMAGDYIRFSIIGLPFVFYTEAFRRYLQVQENTLPVMGATFAAVASSPLFNYLYINVAGMGALGAALTTISTNFLCLTVLLLYIILSGFYKKTWGGFSKEAFQDWWEFISLGLPGTGMLCAEWWGFEVHTLIAGQQGTTALGAQSLLTNMNSFLFMISLGLGITASTRVGTLLGKGKPFSSRNAAMVSLSMALIAQGCVALALAIFRHGIAEVFTDDMKIRRVFAEVLPIISFFCIFDGFQGTASGVLRGAGRQMVGFIVNFLAYWVFAVPVGYYAALHFGDHYRPPEKDEPQGDDILVKGLGVAGQWQVLTIASISVTVVLIFFLLSMDWKKATILVVEREEERRLEEEALQREVAEQSLELTQPKGFDEESSIDTKDIETRPIAQDDDPIVVIDEL